MAASGALRPLWLPMKRIKLQPLLLPTPQIATFTSSSSNEYAPSTALGAVKQEDYQLQPAFSGRTKIIRESLIGAPLRPQDEIRQMLVQLAKKRNINVPPGMDPDIPVPRLPRNVSTLYMAPLKKRPTHGNVVANLQLRSFSVRNLELMADFAMRAAFYLNLPARGPVTLPRITQRWTVPKSHFIYKKTQENFERVTVRRLVQIKDGDPDVIRRWLGFVRKWCWYGVGLKADVFENEDMDVVKRMDEVADKMASEIEGVKWELFGRRIGLDSVEEMEKILDREGFSGPGANEVVQEHLLNNSTTKKRASIA